MLTGFTDAGLNRKLYALLFNSDAEFNGKLSSFLITRGIVLITVENDDFRIESPDSADLLIIHSDYKKMFPRFSGMFENISTKPILFFGDENKDISFLNVFNIPLLDVVFNQNNFHEFQFRILNLLRYNKCYNETNHDGTTLDKLKKEKEELLSITAHDLKNPIYSISMLSKVIRDDKNLSKNDIYEFSNDIIKTSDKMLELIKNLLEINSIEEGKIAINKEEFNLDELIEKSLGVYREIAGKKSISIQFETTHPGIKVFSDKSAVIQIFDNLTSNAIKFSEFSKDIDIRVSSNKDYASFSVRDFGPGMTETDKAKLFTKFARMTAQPTADENSTGLGLYIVKKMVDLLKGQILVSSVLGEGTMFTVLLPNHA